ncbi:MAG: hypothetical protein J0L58_00670 [Burkholderiales bacterium]|nr:hypothetical protein [Burkholderiales bacterium]
MTAAQAIDTKQWLADHAQLKAAMAAGYANLDSLKAGRRLDLAAWDRRTLEALEQARSDREAKQALEALLQAFGDGHLRLLPPAPAALSVEKARPTEPAPQSCSDLGYRKARMRAPALADLDAYTPLGSADDALFPAGVLRLDAERQLGVIRIAAFGEDAYLALCERQLPAPKPCDRACATEVWKGVGRELSEALARQVAALQARQVAALLIDLTGNGGGTEWVETAARIVAGPQLASPRLGFVRHPHWVKRLETRLEALRADLERPDLAEPLRALLISAQTQVQAALNQARQPCDRSGIWQGEAACESLASAELFTTGHLAVRPSLDLQGLRSARSLFSPPYAPEPEIGFRGRLAVLVDRRTASAAEQFAAMLKDGAGALLLGERTLGAGCGYTAGGIQTVLSHSGLRLRMPDCARLRKDGSNEVLGVAPDLTLPAQRFDALQTALTAWLSESR